MQQELDINLGNEPTKELNGSTANNISIDLAFHQSPFGQLLIDPFANCIVLANQRASDLLATSSLEGGPLLRQRLVSHPSINNQTFINKRASQLFGKQFPEWLIFTQETLDFSEAWSDSLSLQPLPARTDVSASDMMPEALEIEVTSQKIRANDQFYLLLTFQPLATLNGRRRVSEAQRHYRSGIDHWDRVATVFREFERENQLILDAAGEGIYGVDNDGRTTFVNSAAEHMLGWTKQDLLGRNVHYVIHHSHKNGEHFHSSDCSIFQAIRDGIQRNVDNEVFWTKDGKAIDVEYTSTPIKDDERIVGAVVIFRDVTQKRLDRKQLVDALTEVELLKNRLEMENAYLQEEFSSEYNHHHIVGKSPAINVILEKIAMVGPTDATTLIAGESGTGKELIARAIHEVSQRRDRSLIRVNCAAIPADLFESEFFGHRRGAFTGAAENRVGRFELADGGTLFLDEVGEIPLALQGKLLRVLQEQTFERVGESKTRTVDVRIIAATNKDLKLLVAQGKFREDLYFRLNVFPIESVPLRNRKEDIALLAAHFLKRASTKAHKPNLKIPLSQIDNLTSYNWPGNIRELENVIERQVILARGDTLYFNDLVNEAPIDHSNAVPEHNRAVVTDAELKQKEKQNILAALKQSGGKVSGEEGAARILNLKPTTLASRIKKYRIEPRAYKKGH